MARMTRQDVRRHIHARQRDVATHVREIRLHEKGIARHLGAIRAREKQIVKISNLMSKI
ncbi:MAG: hypothetical protein M1548_09640 [Actinobacteria bacterium]|nr:hypothetical protein [Actinomycetota bacterium]